MNNHHNSVVRKPWGYEYLVYKNDDVSLWLLNINKGKKTSIHCHPTKTTGLVLLEGIAEMIFLSDKKIIKAPHKQMIRRGLFHQTHALTNLLLLEAETPVNKDDLVRLYDDYGRSNEGYESSNFEVPKGNDCIWIDNPTGQEISSYEIGECSLFVLNAYRGCLHNFDSNDIVMVLQGGLNKTVNSKIHKVIIPGDVGLVKVVKQVEIGRAS